MHDKAATKIRMQEGFTRQIEIIEGILQGESLSPLLFSLFISDIEEKINSWNIPGINILGSQILHLAFADDMVCLAIGPKALQAKINKLEE